jgi:hypothetical protein
VILDDVAEVFVGAYEEESTEEVAINAHHVLPDGAQN